MSGGEPVRLHLYDVGSLPSVRKANDLGARIGLGALHAGVEVYGLELSFAYHEYGGSGLVSYTPMQCEQHTYRETIEMGVTKLSRAGVAALIHDLRPEWPATGYDLLRRNCCTCVSRGSRASLRAPLRACGCAWARLGLDPARPTPAHPSTRRHGATGRALTRCRAARAPRAVRSFADVMCVRLGVGNIPERVNRLAGAGAVVADAYNVASSVSRKLATSAGGAVRALDQRYALGLEGGARRGFRAAGRLVQHVAGSISDHTVRGARPTATDGADDAMPAAPDARRSAALNAALAPLGIQPPRGRQPGQP